jgi:hypothetical protein
MNDFNGEYFGNTIRGMGGGPLKDYDMLITQVRRQIAELAEQLRALESERQAYLRQRSRRSHYLSSREILQLLAARHGRTSSMATIKRWADEGHLGEVIEERQAFPLLSAKQGRQRFLYPKHDVYRFLHEKGLLQPVYEVLDRVNIWVENTPRWAVVVSSTLADDRFVYDLQLEETGEILNHVPEEKISGP